MTSEAKAAANGRNAQKSTGPRTESGKKRSGMNALRHGILASDQNVFFGAGAEDKEAFAALVEELAADLRAGGSPIERLLVEKLALIVWRWRRVLLFEVGAVQAAADEAAREWAVVRLDRISEINPFFLGREYYEQRARAAEELAETLANPDPFARPTQALLAFIAREAESLGLPIREQWRIDPNTDSEAEDFDWEDADFLHVDRSDADRVFAELAARSEMSELEKWAQLRDKAKEAAVQTRELADMRDRAESDVRAKASIPSEEATNRILRYEGHLAREFDRSLSQFEKIRDLREKLDPS